MRRIAGTIVAAVACLGLVACEGPQGDMGMDGPQGAQGPQGQTGPAGKDGQDGQTGETGQTGTPGLACWDSNANGTCDTASEDVTGDGKCDVNDCKGTPGETGQPGAGYLPLESAGIVGFVRDTSGRPVIGATVYLVDSKDIPTGSLDLAVLANAKNSTEDEPLEDTIAAKGATLTKSLTDPNGIYRIPAVATGRYYIVAVPATSDAGHLPGGSLCRESKPSTEIVGKQLDIELSTRPSDKAEFVGPSVCLNCHGMVHQQGTLHMLGIRKIGETGPLQDSSKFPNWNAPLAKFTTTGTTIYYYAYANNDWKVSETNPGTGVSFSARMYKDAAGKYMVELVNVATPSDPARVFEAEMSYGGGLYKQRWVTTIDGSRYILPIQFNYQGQTDETTPYSRWVWGQYNAQNWYDETTKKLRVPAKSKSFDNNCAGCHFTGYKVTGDATVGFKASAVADRNGEMDFNGDGKLETLNVSCESCHGPGSEHWQKAGAGRAIVNPRLLTPEREVTICASCHTRALGVGFGATETPLNNAGVLPVAGTSRTEFLTNYISKLDDGQWDTDKGDGMHAKKHHQQVSDFLKSKKYRNEYDLLTCSSCHELHGNSGLPHQVADKVDRVSTGEGLCMNCHTRYFPQPSANLATREQAHYAAKGVANMPMGDIGCVDCHMPKTAKSGSGLKQATIQGVTYFSGDISSHVFDVPLRTSIKTKAADMMAIPYTDSCGTCHTAAP